MAGLESARQTERAALEQPPAELGEPAFDRVESRGRGWGEVTDKAGMPPPPGWHLGVLGGDRSPSRLLPAVAIGDNCRQTRTRHRIDLDGDPLAHGQPPSRAADTRSELLC